MKKISEIIGFEPIDIHSHFDHNVPWKHSCLRVAVFVLQITMEFYRILTGSGRENME